MQPGISLVDAGLQLNMKGAKLATGTERRHIFHDRRCERGHQDRRDEPRRRWTIMTEHQVRVVLKRISRPSVVWILDSCGTPHQARVTPTSPGTPPGKLRISARSR